MAAPLFNVDGQVLKDEKAKLGSTQRSNENLHLSNALSEININNARVQSSHPPRIKANAQPNINKVVRNSFNRSATRSRRFDAKLP